MTDHPIGGHPVRIHALVRRFRCRNPTCASNLRRAAPDHRRALGPAPRPLEDVGLHHGGRPGQRFAERGKIRVHRMTLLPLVRRLPEPPVSPPRALGIDDVALKREHRSRTIYFEVERRRIVDLLPARTAAVVATWITEYWQPEVVCRDRGGDYAAAARLAAPTAVQIADRCHLVPARAARALKGFSPAIHPPYALPSLTKPRRVRRARLIRRCERRRKRWQSRRFRGRNAGGPALWRSSRCTKPARRFRRLARNWGYAGPRFVSTSGPAPSRTGRRGARP